MDKCSFIAFEQNFRNSDPERADYLTNLALTLWSELKNSNRFKQERVNNTKALVASRVNTKQRERQEEFIKELNNKINSPNAIRINSTYSTLIVDNYKLIEIPEKINLDSFKYKVILPKPSDKNITPLDKTIDKLTENVNQEDYNSPRDIKFFRGDRALMEQEENDLNFLQPEDPFFGNEIATEKLPSDVKNIFEEELTNNNPVTLPDLKTDLIPDNINQQFVEFENLKNKVPQTEEEFNKKTVYSLILPNISADRFDKVFSLTNPEDFDKYRQEKINKIIKSFTEKFGISVETVNNFQDRSVVINNKTLSYNGVANLANKTIKYLEGDNAALTEEVAHFMVAMLPKNSSEYLGLKNYISSTPEYELYYDKYLEAYNNDVDKTEEEIMGKVLANSLLGNKESVPLSLKSIITRIKNFLKNFLTPLYQQEFNKSLKNINHLFFTENFETLFNEANISFDELYSLDFLAGEQVNTFNKGSNQIIKTLIQNLQRQRQRFIENKQTNFVKKTDDLIEILKNQDPQEDNASKLKTYIEGAMIEMQRLQQSFAEFEASGVIYDLSKKDYKNLTREEQNLQTQEDRQNHLNYIAAAINTLQNLNSFIQLIKENFRVINDTKESLTQYRQIIDNLDLNNPEALLFKNILDSTVNNNLSVLENIYIDLSSKLINVGFKAFNTQEQEDFLKTVDKNIIYNKNANGKDVITDVSMLSTLKDYFLGKFSGASSKIEKFDRNLRPISFQPDLFLKGVDNANAAFRQIAMNSTLKTISEMTLLQSQLNQLGVFDESWVSAKSPNGKKSFKLLQKYNYKLFKSTLANKIVKKHLKKLTEYTSVIQEINDNDKKILNKLFKKDFKSPNEIKGNLNILKQNQQISERLYLFLNNYIDALEKGYTLQFLEPNPDLTPAQQDILNRYKNLYINQLAIKIQKLNFNGNTLPRLKTNFIFSPNGVTEDEFLSVAKALVENKKNKLIAKHVIVPEFITDSNNQVNPNPVYATQMSYVEGLLNYFKQTIGYVENIDGTPKLYDFDILYFGPETFFNLSDKKNIEGIEYLDKDYQTLENDLNSNDTKVKKIAETKLTILKKIEKLNLDSNKPSNFLPSIPKYNSAQYLGDSKQFRGFLNTFIRVLPAALLAGNYSTNAFYALGLYYFSIFNIDQITQFAYYMYNGLGPKKALSLLFGSNIREEFREETIEENKALAKNPEKAAKILANFLKKYSGFNAISNFFNKSQPTNEIIDTNNYLLGEYQIPKPFESKQFNKLELSTDFIGNYKTYLQAVNNYETSIRWESFIRMAADLQEKRTGINDTSAIDAIKNRYFYSKFYNNSKLIKAIRLLTATTSRTVLMGNQTSAEGNLLVGIDNVLIHTNLLTLPKAFITVLRDLSQKIYNNIGIAPVVSDFVNLITGKDTTKNRTAVFTTLADLFTGKNTSEFNYQQNVTSHIAKYLRKNRGTGFTIFDEAESYLIRASNLTNIQGAQNLGEKFIDQLLINQYFLSNPLVDELGNPIKNLKRYLKIVDGRVVLDKTKLGLDKVYLKSSLKTRAEAFRKNNIQIESNVSISNPTPIDLNLNPLNDLELDIFLNETMPNNISNISQMSQGVYSIFDKAVHRLTALGLLLLQFKDYVRSSLDSTISSKKVYNDFTSTEVGVINTLDTFFTSRLVRLKNKLSKETDKDAKIFNADVYQNLLILNNIRSSVILKELGILKNVSKITLKYNNKIDKILKDLASNNNSFRKSIKSDTSIDTSINILNKITLENYTNNLKPLSDKNLLKEIIIKFNLNNKSKTFVEQQDYILNLLKQKFDKNIPIDENQIKELEQFDVNQNFVEIVEAYDKLQNNLSGNIKSLDRLTNFTVALLGGFSLTFIAFLTSLFLDEPEKEEELESLTFFNWAKTMLENKSLSLISTYFPILELDTFGVIAARLTADFKKTSGTINNLFKIVKNTYNSLNWRSESTLKNSDENLNFFLAINKLAKREDRKVPILKPIIYKDPDTRKITFQTDEQISESLVNFVVPTLVTDNFELFKSKKAQERYEELRGKSYIELKAIKVQNTKFARYNEGSVDPRKQIARKKLLEKFEEKQERERELKEAGAKEALENQNSFLQPFE